MGLFSKSEFKSKYVTGKILGKGNYAVVRQCRCKATGENLAVKILTIDMSNVKEYNLIKKEIAILEKLKHKSIVQLKEIFEVPKSHHQWRVYIVMELVTGGEVFDKIVEEESFTEAKARAIMKSLLEALDFAHSEGCAHRDLKPENILLCGKDAETIKIADWGLGRFYLPDQDGQEELMHTMCGTPAYLAPEVIQRTGYGFSCDIWSSGVILYVMLCGFLPYQSSTRNNLFRIIRKGDYSFPSPYWDKISSEAKDLIDCMFTVDPDKRISAKEALKHPWMTKETDECHESFQDEHKEQMDSYIKEKKAAKANVSHDHENDHDDLDLHHDLDSLKIKA